MDGPIEAERDANRARFARLVARHDAEIDLALGALAIAAEGRDGLDPAPTIRALDHLAELVRIRVDVGDAQTHVLERLHDVLYREAGFRPPRPDAFRDPDNSRLDRVVERRIGLPINLAIVELEVAWRIGLDLVGIGLPGHFIIGAPGGVMLDPADRGRRLTRDNCQALIRSSIGEGVLFQSSMLRPVGRREILARVLRNLRAAHLDARDWPAALGVVDLLAIVEPTMPEHGRDRGLLLGRMGRFSEALDLLSRYLIARPDAHDVDDVRQVIGIFAGRRN